MLLLLVLHAHRAPSFTVGVTCDGGTDTAAGTDRGRPLLRWAATAAADRRGAGQGRWWGIREQRDVLVRGVTLTLKLWNLESEHHVDVRAKLEGVVFSEARRACVPIAHVAAKHELSQGVESGSVWIVVIAVELRVAGELGHHAVASDVRVFLAAAIDGRQRHVVTPLQHSHGH
jgi:hypothetical protein